MLGWIELSRSRQQDITVRQVKCPGITTMIIMMGHGRDNASFDIHLIHIPESPAYEKQPSTIMGPIGPLPEPC
jgi:hypothetical protein